VVAAAVVLVVMAVVVCYELFGMDWFLVDAALPAGGWMKRWLI
jgi:hypothetical protein